MIKCKTSTMDKLIKSSTLNKLDHVNLKIINRNIIN